MRFRLFGLARVMLTFALLLSVMTNTAYADDDIDDWDDDYIANEVVVKLNVATDLDAILAEYNLSLIDQFGTRPIYQLKINDTTLSPDKALQLLADTRVLLAEPNYVHQIPELVGRISWSGGSAGDYTEQWAPDTIRLPEAHQRSRGQGVTIAVLDTGIDRDHPIFSHTTVLTGFDFVDYDDDPSEQGDPTQHLAYGHGTHVAGLIATVAPEAQLLPIRVLDSNGVGNMWVLLEGLQYAANQGVDVINLSFSFTRDNDIIEEVLEEIVCSDLNDVDVCIDDDDDDDDDDEIDDDDEDDKDSRDTAAQEECDDEICPHPGGVVVVAAAGNRGSEQPEYPAADKESGMLAVASSTVSDTLALFSNYGAWVDLAAPGENIISSVPNQAYGAWSGTSMSTPLVAGTAALLRASDATLTSTDVASRIKTTATPICALVPQRLDAAAALGATPQQQTSFCQLHLPVLSN